MNGDADRRKFVPLIQLGGSLIDTTAPTVTITSTESSPTAAATIPIAFELSEASVDFAIGDLTVSGGTAGNFAGSGTSYTCDVTPDGDAPVTVQVAAGAFHDEAGNGNAESDLFEIGITVTLTYQPDGTTGLDTYLYEASPTTNNGTDTSIYAGGGGGTSNILRSLFKFSEIPTPAATPTVVSATLTLTCTDNGAGVSRNMDIHRSVVQWFETGSTWNLRNTTGSVAWEGGAGGGSVVDYVALRTARTAVLNAGAYDFDVTADVQDWMDGSATNQGWWLKGELESINTYKGFASSDNATAGSRPKLVIVVNF